MGQAATTLFTELWGDQTLNALKRAQKETQRVFNGITDYTPFVKNKKAAGYHGPKFTGIAGETVARGAGFASVQDATETSFDIDFAQKSGGCFSVDIDEDLQTDINLIEEYGAEMAEEIMDEYDIYILTALIAGCAAGNKVNFAGAGTTADKLTYQDFLNADEVLNTANAPRNGRYCFIDPVHLADMYLIDQFINRDKIPDANLREGIAGKLLNFNIVLTPNMPMVDIAGAINATAAKNDSYPVFFIQSLAYGWGRQQELQTMQADVPQNTLTQRSLWSIHGGAVQEQTFIYQVSDQTTADPI